MTEKIKVTFLGTGSAVPTKRRNHPAILVQYKEENILFDCGEGTQRQFRKADLNPSKLTRIFISHWHGDHILGLSGLLQTLMLNSYNKTLYIYGPKGTKYFMEIYEKMYMQKGNFFDIKIHELTSQTAFESEEIIIESKEMDHDAPCLAYSLTIKEKSRITKEKLAKFGIPSNNPLIGKLAKEETVEFNGKKIDGKKLIYKEPSRKITYITDTRENENIVSLAKNSNILICESTYSSEEESQAKDYAHLTAKQAAKIAKDSQSKKLFLVHLSQKYEDPKKILKEAKETFKETRIPEDLDKIEF